MRHRVRLLVTLAALASAWSGVALSQDPPSWDLDLAPRFYNLPTAEGSGMAAWLSMECDGQGPRYMRMTCRFTHTSIRQPSEDDVRAAVEQARATEIDPSGLAGLRSHCERERLPVCECFGRASSAEVAGCVRDELARSAEANARSCRVSTHAFQADFERVGRTRWHATTRGLLCSNVTAMVLDSDESYTLWAYTQTRVAVDDPSDPLCGGLTEGSRVRYDWRSPRTFPIACSSVRSE